MSKMSVCLSVCRGPEGQRARGPEDSRMSNLFQNTSRKTVLLDDGFRKLYIHIYLYLVLGLVGGANILFLLGRQPDPSRHSATPPKPWKNPLTSHDVPYPALYTSPSRIPDAQLPLSSVLQDRGKPPKPVQGVIRPLDPLQLGQPPVGIVGPGPVDLLLSLIAVRVVDIRVELR